MESAMLSIQDGPAELADAAAATSATAAGDTPDDADEELLVEEIWIDDVSIDGMCGVY